MRDRATRIRRRLFGRLLYTSGNNVRGGTCPGVLSGGELSGMRLSGTGANQGTSSTFSKTLTYERLAIGEATVPSVNDCWQCILGISVKVASK